MCRFDLQAVEQAVYKITHECSRKTSTESLGTVVDSSWNLLCSYSGALEKPARLKRVAVNYARILFSLKVAMTAVPDFGYCHAVGAGSSTILCAQQQRPQQRK